MKDDINKRWDGYNRDYAKDHEKINPEVQGEFKEALKLCTPLLNEKILEIGCNTGEFCWLLKNKYNLEPEGIDINDEAIKIATKKYPEIDFKVKDFFDLDGKYDVIYMQHVIEHMQEPEKAILKLKNLLNHRGKLVITCPNKWAYTSKLFCWLRKTKFCYDPTHVYEFNPIELSQLIKNAGFNQLKIRTKPLGIPFIYRISINIQYNLPAYLLGDFIFISVENP
jgi:2-polyprenyl-3-methyl-5-hydroxy-6-metoxy-1,4-benzoquinol methylase